MGYMKSYYNILKDRFYLLKGDHQVRDFLWGSFELEAEHNLGSAVIPSYRLGFLVPLKVDQQQKRAALL